jgi:hypothetical protein
MKLNNYLKTQQQKREDAITTFIGYCIAPFLTGAFFAWYNYILIQWPIGYWKWVALSLPMLLIPKWLTTPIFGIVFSVTAVAQVCKWLGLTVLPLIKL